jgi:predicted DCC family thiol-disulfide oxidoreductase YuxK
MESDNQPVHPPLLTPRELPSADIVIYDGQCVFCTRQVRNLQWWDGKNRLAFLSLHDEWVTKRFPELTHEQLMTQIYVIPHQHPERHYGGASALRYLSRRLPKLWFAAPLLHIPLSLPLWQWLYRIVASRRYKIAGRSGHECDPDGTCELHFKKKKSTP